MSGFLRIVLLVAVAVVAYRYLTRRKKISQEPKEDLQWQVIFKEELADLKKSIPVGYYVNLLALSKSKMSKDECIARLDELVAKMKGEELDTHSVETLILKIEQENQFH